MTEEAKQAQVSDQPTPDIPSAVKPELTPEMAQWLVTKLDCPVQLDSHAERNNFASVINKLIAIANWKDPE